jgi:hypothetical protein
MPTVKKDSNFAQSILEIAINDDASKAHIATAAEALKATVITPILEKLNSGTALEAYETQVLDFFAAEHSSDGSQWGGALTEHCKADIMKNPELQKELLTKLSDQLAEDYIKGLTDIDKLAGVMKAVTDCSFTYVERFPAEKRGGNFSYIKDMITPTPEELAIRVTRVEKGLEEHRAISYGIGTEVGKDVAPASSIPEDVVRAHKAGKAAFASADVYDRAEMIAINYDKAVDMVKKLELKLEEGTPVAEDLDEAKKVLSRIAGEMTFYRIPLEPVERPANLRSLASIPRPGIQQLAGLIDAEGLTSPLIATASGTTARTLIALHDLRAFNDKTGTFQSKSAQYLSTVLCGTIVHGGHHSVLEVGEMYNRLLDCQALTDLQDDKLPHFHETEMAYYRIGDSASLLPDAMKDPVVIKYYTKNQADMKSELPKKIVPSQQSSDEYQPPTPSMKR